MLDEQEWSLVAPLLRESLRAIQDFRAEHGVSLADTPMARLYARALDEYERLTGYRERDPQTLWHHRRSLHGPPCAPCGQPLRTPRATSCAACGARSEASG